MTYGKTYNIWKCLKITKLKLKQHGKVVCLLQFSSQMPDVFLLCLIHCMDLPLPTLRQVVAEGHIIQPLIEWKRAGEYITFTQGLWKLLSLFTLSIIYLFTPYRPQTRYATQHRAGSNNNNDIIVLLLRSITIHKYKLTQEAVFTAQLLQLLFTK